VATRLLMAVFPMIGYVPTNNAYW